MFKFGLDVETVEQADAESVSVIPAEDGNEQTSERKSMRVLTLLDLLVERLARNQVGDVIVTVVILFLLASLLLCLHGLVGFGQLAERSQAVGAKLVEDTGDQFSQLLLFTVTVDSECVRGDRGVDYKNVSSKL